MSEKRSLKDQFNVFATKEIIRLATLKEKLVKDSTNFAVSACLSRFGNATFVKAEAALEEVFSTDAPNTLVGQVAVSVKVAREDGVHLVEVPIQVEAETPTLPEHFQFEQAMKAAPVVEEFITDANVVASLPLLANLADFRLIEEEKGTLKVFHKAFDMGDRAIGVLSTAEYISAPILHKEAMLQEVLQDAFTHSEAVKTHELKFEGSFIEPKIQKLAGEPAPLPDTMCECVTTGCPAHPRGACIAPATQTLKREGEGDALEYHFCDVCAKEFQGEEDPLDLGLDEREEAHEDESTKELTFEDIGENTGLSDDEDLSYKMPNFKRQLEESHHQVLTARAEKLATSVANSIVNHLLGAKYGDVKVDGIDRSALKYSEDTDSFDGAIKVVASLTQGREERLISLIIPVVQNGFKMPTRPELKAAFTSGINLRARLEQQLANETQAALEAIDAKELEKQAEVNAILTSDLHKTAGDMNSTQYVGPNTLMHLNKHLLGLPEDTEIGTIIFADGAHWKLIDKNRQQMSKGENDGSIWSFEKVNAGDELPEHRLTI